MPETHFHRPPGTVFPERKSLYNITPEPFQAQFRQHSINLGQRLGSLFICQNQLALHSIQVYYRFRVKRVHISVNVHIIIIVIRYHREWNLGSKPGNILTGNIGVHNTVDICVGENILSLLGSKA